MTKPLIWAHRGASGYAPENTFAAFEKAVELGADGIELDIQMTRDHEIVVLHDETIDRTSTGKGWVKDYTFNELKRFDFSFEKKFPGSPRMHIPRMSEVFALIKPTGLTINIELKTGVVFYEGIEEAILEMTAAYGMEDRVVYSSFNHYTLKKLKYMNPKAETGILYSDGYIDMPAYAQEQGAQALHPALYNLQYPDFMEECRKRGIQVRPWTVNKEAHLKQCLEMGTDAVITNYPDRARKIFEVSTQDKQNC